jgi:hypothetical protein
MQAYIFPLGEYKRCAKTKQDKIFSEVHFNLGATFGARVSLKAGVQGFSLEINLKGKSSALDFRRSASPAQNRNAPIYTTTYKR